MKVMNNKIENYKLIDLIKFIFAYLVIGIHIRPFQASSILINKLFYYNISNYAVPFFYACTGYFLIIKKQEEDLHMKIIVRCKKIAKIYLIWSAVYLPLTVFGWKIDGNLNPIYLLECLRNFFFVGENFYSWTLWYLNGLIFALLLIDLLSRRLSIKQIVFVSSVIYVIGIVLNMINGHLDMVPFILAKPISLYFFIFVTTRNGLFQSLVFVSIGMFVAQIECLGKLKVAVKEIFVIIGFYIVKVAFSLIGGGQYISQILDLVIFLFIFRMVILWCSKIDLKGTFYIKLRKMSETIYFVHMYFVALCALILYRGNYHNFIAYCICAGGATIIAWIYHK